MDDNAFLGSPEVTPCLRQRKRGRRKNNAREPTHMHCIKGSFGSTNIVVIKSEDEYTSAISKAKDGAEPALFYFTAVWCGPCKFISPVIGELSEQYPHVTTYKIDIDEEGLTNTLGKLNISSVPTFQFFQDGKKVAEVVGADVARLRDTFGKLYK
ncbi:thioredoxin O1, mitochondrial-like [Pyrus x bretschneideri]|uniref:thioredoxin O1, mitochondrial-like n=1 Tax=Pyrus x bretschneideri TaxID=225117 RepID=UPI002030B71E|nr:thioredoxin O1, mitochondrial-like [Pyrus x bretschneideri]